MFAIPLLTDVCCRQFIETLFKCDFCLRINEDRDWQSLINCVELLHYSALSLFYRELF